MRRPPFRAVSAVLVLALAGLASTDALASPQGTAFTYQGMLSQSGMNVVASTDLRFTLWDAEMGGSAVGSSIVLTVTPDEGVFSVDLDFGSSPFSTNEARWLEIEASPAGAGMFESLGRTALRATTYSLSTRGISVDDAGNVGIGTTDPDALLNIQGTGGIPVRIDDPATAGFELRANNDFFTAWAIFDNASNDNFTIRESSGAFDVFVANGAQGRIGMGTSSPNANVHINERGTNYGPTAFAGNTVLGVSASDAVLELVSDETGSFGSTLGFKQVNSGSGAIEDHWAFTVGTAGTFDFRYGSGLTAGGNARFATVLPSGSIGINDPSPEGKFDVAYNGIDDGIGIDVEASDTTATSIGVSASQFFGRAIFGQTVGETGTNFGVYGEVNALNANGWGVFSNGRLGASGTKSFCIDHPLDPANWYLLHYSTEAPEPLNTYSGNAVFDAQGLATIELPAYFESINANPRYHLTPVGAAMPNLHVARVIQDGVFVVAGGVPGAQVSWQVTATRNDAFVRTMGAPVELQKSPDERGRYLMPELFGQPKTMGVHTRTAP